MQASSKYISLNISLRKISIKLVWLAYRLFTLLLISLTAFYISLLATSKPAGENEMTHVNRAIAVLEAKGFTREVVTLRHFAVYRSNSNWLNLLTQGEDSYASTNFPFGIITLHEDFYSKATDDTERAAILLHEAQHLEGANEAGAYGYVWQKRNELGWTILKYGTTPTFVTIELQTREYAPELFTCRQNLWNDCTEMLRAQK